MFENHQTFLGELLSARNKRMDAFLKEQLADSTPLFDLPNIMKPSFVFDEVFLLAHAANHFRLEGLVVRHLID